MSGPGRLLSAVTGLCKMSVLVGCWAGGYQTFRGWSNMRLCWDGEVFIVNLNVFARLPTASVVASAGFYSVCCVGSGSDCFPFRFCVLGVWALKYMGAVHNPH